MNIRLPVLIGCLTAAAVVSAQSRLPGEFSDINLGRTMLEPKGFPTLTELRQAVRDPKIKSVAMLKLHGDGNNHYLPVWSGDGTRLAFQRSDVKQRISKILLFGALSQPKPSVLDDSVPSYDSMFRWGKSSPAGFAFARIDSESGAVKVWISTDGGQPALRNQKAQRNRMPELYERTDGIWLMASEKDGKVVIDAWSGDELVDEPKLLGAGTSPRWSADGGTLLYQRARSGKVGAFDIVLQSRKADDGTQLSISDVVRSPAWSPDEKYAAWFAKDAGDNKQWRIETAAVSGPSKPRAIANDVVVNLLFESDEPTWEPTSRRLWCFSHRQRQQAYYPLLAVDVASGQEQVIDYPQRCTNPSDLAINPRTEVPELTFVAHDGTPQDLYVLFLNHY